LHHSKLRDRQKTKERVMYGLTINGPTAIHEDMNDGKFKSQFLNINVTHHTGDL